MPVRTRLTALVLIVAAAVVVSPPLAGAEGDHNVVSVVNQVDGRAAPQARAVVTADHGPIVADENTALARASCTDCRTVAVAVQLVVIDGTVSEFVPLNAAVALNEACTRCETYAYARQEIITVDGGFALSGAGRDAVQRIEDDIDAVAASGESFADIGTELDALTVDLVGVVQSDVGRSGHRAEGHTTRRAVDQRSA
jgi:putative peptide zinc metalloprotease protein